MSKEALANVTKQAFTVDVESTGLGIQRSSGTYIGMFLQMEDPGDRVSVLVDVLKKLGIAPEEISDQYYETTCCHCGMSDSPMHPCECKRIPPVRCKDCDDAAKHAYSDATTPGFFFTKCEKHRERVP